MEGIGSRLGRASSRYGAGPAPSAPVFDGPVRKWKRQWVLCQSDTVARGKGNHHHQQKPPPLLLCRWTPLPSTSPGDSIKPPKRKFRYTPVLGKISAGSEVTVLEGKKKEALEKVSNEAEASVTVGKNLAFQKSPVSNALTEEIEELNNDHAYLNRAHLDLQLCLEKP